MRSIWDQKAIERQLFNDGKAEGRAEGLAEGRAEGLAEGEAKGKAEGEAAGKAALIMAMLANGMSVETLAGATGMKTEEIQSLVCSGAQ